MSEKRGKKMSIHESLLAFAAEFGGAQKSGKNPHFNSEYMTLDDVVRATAPILAKHDLYVLHNITTDESGTWINTAVYHKDSDCISSALPLTVGANSQAMGSQITYAKRYNMCALLNIAEADDDGNAATLEATKQEQRKDVKIAKPANKTQWDVLRKLAVDNPRRLAYLEGQADMNSVKAEKVISSWEFDEK